MSQYKSVENTGILIFDSFHEILSMIHMIFIISVNVIQDGTKTLIKYTGAHNMTVKEKTED